MTKSKSVTVTGPNMVAIMAQNLLNNMRIGKESEIVIHDIYNHAYTVYNESELIEVIDDENYNR